MKRADITYLVGSVFMGCTALFYCATIAFSVKLPRYYPLEHAWKWVKEEGVPSQAWYGMQAVAFLAAGELGVSSIQYYVLAYTFMNIGAFAIITGALCV